MAIYQEEQNGLGATQAWRFAGLVQRRLAQPKDEKAIAVPANAQPMMNWQKDCTGGAFTFVARDGRYIRAVCEVEKNCETWVDVSSDAGKTWQRIVTITREDETIDDRVVASVLHPYIYPKLVNGEPWIVLGVSVAEKDTKCWDIREREAPLAQLEQLKTAYVHDALPGNAEFAYKDGVPIQSPDGKGVYFCATRHHISSHAEEGVNADTVFCKLSEKSRRYETLSVLLPQAARGGIDVTCNRLTSELVLPDQSRFWSSDVRNVETENAALTHPLVPGSDPAKWVLGDFNEVTSFAVVTWREGSPSPKAVSVDAVLGRSKFPQHPALRCFSATPLIPLDHLRDSKENDPVVLITYERADAKGVKSFFQQTIFRQELLEALTGNGPKLRIEQDPLA